MTNVRKFWTLAGWPIAVEADTPEDAFIKLSEGLVEAAESIRAGADVADIFNQRVVELDDGGKRTVKITDAGSSASTAPAKKKWVN